MVKRKRSKIDMPMSTAGLIRYMDEEGRGMKIKPEHVVYVAGGIVAANIFMKLGFI
jgi:preprotein translocase subunit Sec61beta